MRKQDVFLNPVQASFIRKRQSSGKAAEHSSKRGAINIQLLKIFFLSRPAQRIAALPLPLKLQSAPFCRKMGVPVCRGLLSACSLRTLLAL